MSSRCTEPVKEDILVQRIRELREILRLQLTTGNWDFDPYMHGLANGLILAMATMDGVTPDYLEPPEEWVADSTGLGSDHSAHSSEETKTNDE